VRPIGHLCTAAKERRRLANLPREVAGVGPGLLAELQARGHNLKGYGDGEVPALVAGVQSDELEVPGPIKAKPRGRWRGGFVDEVIKPENREGDGNVEDIIRGHLLHIHVDEWPREITTFENKRAIPVAKNVVQDTKLRCLPLHVFRHLQALALEVVPAGILVHLAHL